MQHFLEISQLSKMRLETILQRAFEFKNSKKFPAYPNHPVIHLFYENSTRTRLSFELAAQRLSMPCLHFDSAHSSEHKGESIEDTLHNLIAMGISCFVLRHKQEGLLQQLAQKASPHTHIISAGEGTKAHPSQALLDIMTILEQKPRLDELKIALVGDIKHSRVAHSFQQIAALMGIGELVLVAPALWQPESLHYGRLTEDLRDGLQDADVVMCLRVQKERLLEEESLDLGWYRQNYALTATNLAYAKSSAMVMHPGPMNRGVEIDSEVADGGQSFILQQVNNGVYARMAVLDALVG